MIVYDKLWETLKEKGITQYKLIHEYGISPAQITRLKRNNNVSTHTLDILCEICGCETLIEIAEYVPNEEAQCQQLLSYHKKISEMRKSNKPQ